MGGEQTAILLVGVVHVLAAVVLLAMLFRTGDSSPGPGFWFGTEPDDEDPGAPPGPVAPGGAALPLPDARGSDTRLRGPGRLADAHPRPERRPAHAPGPARTPERT